MRSPLQAVPTWPADLRRAYRDLGYWSAESFADFVATRCARFAQRPALVGVDAHDTPIRWSYADLLDAAETAASRIAAAGVAPGDRVVVALPNIAEYAAVVLGLFRMGALPVFALPRHREVELSQFCALSDAAALVLCGTDADALGLATRVRERMTALRTLGGTQAAPPALVDVAGWAPLRESATPAATSFPRAELGAEDIAFLQLSGGSTGLAKLIPRTAADYLYSVRASAQICELSATTVALVALPAAHNFAMSSPGILGAIEVGACVVLARDPSPRTCFGLIEREGVTTTALVPPLAQAWISAARRRRPDLSSLRTVQVGGARLSDVLAPEIESVFGVRLQQVFGMAEGLVNYTRGDDPDELRHSTQGRPISEHDEILVVDRDDQPVPAGAEGALLTRGPYTIRGYYAAEAVNAASFTPDGFYRTGDLVRRLGSGHLVVTGRENDQINRAGEKVAVNEIEAFLLDHPAVHDAVVVGVPDPRLGERVCAVVVPERDAAIAVSGPVLRGHLQEVGLAGYKVPETWRIVTSLPRTHVGKTSRRDLRTLLATDLAADLAAESAHPSLSAPTRTRPEDHADVAPFRRLSASGPAAARTARQQGPVAPRLLARGRAGP